MLVTATAANGLAAAPIPPFPPFLPPSPYSLDQINPRTQHKSDQVNKARQERQSDQEDQRKPLNQPGTIKRYVLRIKKAFDSLFLCFLEMRQRKIAAIALQHRQLQFRHQPHLAPIPHLRLMPLVLPSQPDPSHQLMNWNILLYGLVGIFSLIYFLCKGKRTYIGPAENIRRGKYGPF